MLMGINHESVAFIMFQSIMHIQYLHCKIKSENIVLCINFFQSQFLPPIFCYFLTYYTKGTGKVLVQTVSSFQNTECISTIIGSTAQLVLFHVHRK